VEVVYGGGGGKGETLYACRLCRRGAHHQSASYRRTRNARRGRCRRRRKTIIAPKLFCGRFPSEHYYFVHILLLIVLCVCVDVFLLLFLNFTSIALVILVVWCIIVLPPFPRLIKGISLCFFDVSLCPQLIR